MPTIMEHTFKKDQDVLVLSEEPLPVFQNTCGSQEPKVNCHRSQHVDSCLEQPKVSIKSNLEMSAALEGKLALQQNDGMPESSPLVCVEDSCWTEPSKPTTAILPNCPNHQNLLVKLLFSTQTDTGCEMLVFCKDSDQENHLFSQEKRTSQEDAEAENQCKCCVQHSKTDSTSKKCPEHSIFSSETSISIKSPEFSNGKFLDTIAGSHSLHKYQSADQQADLESKKFISEVLQITGEHTPCGLLLSETNNDSGELNKSKEFVTPDKLQDSPKIEMGHTYTDQDEVKKSDLIHSEERSMVCLDSAERSDASVNNTIPERDSILSASVDTLPLTITKVHSCLLTADQHTIENKPNLEPAILCSVDTTVSNEHSVSHNAKRNKDSLTGNGQCLRCPITSLADSAEKMTSQIFPELLSKDGGKSEVQELDSEETFAGDVPTAVLSAVDYQESDSKSPMEDEPILPKESMTFPGDLESKEQDPSLDSTHPVYAISSFWDEMEKLTINDILHLRLVGNAQPPREVFHQQDSIVADVSDTADSGYFAHPDDSKPDCWTGDASLLSDFEDELQQTLSASTNPSPEPQDAESQVMWSLEPSGVWREHELDPACMGSDNDAAERMLLPTEDTISQQISSDGTQSFETMCETETTQDLQTPEEEAQFSVPLPVTVRGEGEGSMLLSHQQSPVETCSLALTEHENDAKSLPLPLLSENYVMACPEICKHFVSEGEAEASLSGRASPIFYSPPETSLSGSASPIVISLPEACLSERVSPIVCSLSETSLSGRESPIVSSLSDISLSGTASPIVVALPETSLSGRAPPIVYSSSETCLSDRASPIVVSLPETSLSGRVSPSVYSLSEMSMSDRPSSNVLSLPQTNLSGRGSPIVFSLSEMSLSGRASPIICSVAEMSVSGRASPIVHSPSKTSLSGRSSPMSLSDRAPNELCLPETYDYFFADYGNHHVFFPPILSHGNCPNAGIPIFSCSRSVKREYHFPEEYDYVFPEVSPAESEDEDRHTPIHMVTSFDHQAHEPLDDLMGADEREHFFTDKDWRGNLFWKNLPSLRRLRFYGGLYNSRDRSTSWAFAVTGWRERSSLLRKPDLGLGMDNHSTSYPHPNLYLENQLCNEVRAQRDSDVQAVVSFPKKGFLFTLRQADICLVCIAFASWVLKSANPQSQDMWKTALLANVSAISAIQYLRRYIREDASENKR